MRGKKFSIDFLGIGVEKGGSTWLGQCISEHPEVCFPKGKEIYFFNDVDAHYLKYTTTKYSRGIGWYKNQFSHCSVNSKKGEWAITYLCTEETARRINKYFPNIKLIACLRDPVARAFSQYLYERRLGLINKTTNFEDVLEVRPDYLEKGYYAKQLKNYYKYFNKDQVLVLIYEKLKDNPEKYIRSVWRFLELDNKKFIPPSLKKRINKSGEAFFPKLNFIMISCEYFLRSHGLDMVLRFLEGLGIRRLALKVRDINNKQYSSYPQISKKTKKYLSSFYKNENKDLEKLLGERLSIWEK